jgi:hypothetical protein
MPSTTGGETDVWSPAVFLTPLFGDADGYDGNGFDADGVDRNGYDADGNPKKVDPSDLDLYELWSAFIGTQPEFLDYLRSITRDPGAIDDVVFCIDCGEPAWKDDMLIARGNIGTLLCEDCAENNWSTCDCCGDRYPDDDVTQTLDESTVCVGCRNRNYSYCDACEGYYPDDAADDHYHEDDDDGSGCCTAPQLAFTVRNDGNEPLANDTRVTVSLPAGTISSEGLKAISVYLRMMAHYELARDVEHGKLGDQWQTKAGNFTKRLSRHAYQTYKIKLTPEVLSQVGCIARDHSNPVDVALEVTRDLNQSAADFYHEDSCWWGSWRESRCALKSNGGFGLRTFGGKWDSVTGRAWVMPLRRRENGQLRPTFDTMTPDAFVVFNGYGDLSGYAAPRVVAHMAGWTYRKISFSCSPMYVNAGGFLVAPEEIAQHYTDGQLHLNVDQHSSLFESEQVEKILAAQKETETVNA